MAKQSTIKDKKCKRCGILIERRSTWCKPCSRKEIGRKQQKEDCSYIAIHQWARRNKPKQLICEECENEEKLELANISGKYKRDMNDYKWLCRSCHTMYDNPEGLIGINRGKVKLQ